MAIGDGLVIEDEDIQAIKDMADNSLQKTSAGLGKIAEAVPGTTITVYKSGTPAAWPVRPTSRADITCVWTGPDPSPSIVTSGTGGMRDGIDKRDIHA